MSLGECNARGVPLIWKVGIGIDTGFGGKVSVNHGVDDDGGVDADELVDVVDVEDIDGVDLVVSLLFESLPLSTPGSKADCVAVPGSVLWLPIGMEDVSLDLIFLGGLTSSCS